MFDYVQEFWKFAFPKLGIFFWGGSVWAAEGEEPPLLRDGERQVFSKAAGQPDVTPAQTCLAQSNLPCTIMAQ